MKTYKKRMIKEYKELKERYDKLDAITVKAEAGTLGFKLNCSLGLLLDQKRCMGEYLRCLKIRAEIEGVNINDRSEEKTQGKITFVDTREILEADVRKWFADDYYEDYYSEEDMNSVVSEWLDRQAAITKMEMQAEIEKKGL